MSLFCLDFDYVLKLKKCTAKIFIGYHEKKLENGFTLCVSNIKKCIAEILINVIKKVFQAINY